MRDLVVAGFARIQPDSSVAEFLRIQLQPVPASGTDGTRPWVSDHGPLHPDKEAAGEPLRPSTKLTGPASPGGGWSARLGAMTFSL